MGQARVDKRTNSLSIVSQHCLSSQATVNAVGLQGEKSEARKGGKEMKAL